MPSLLTWQKLNHRKELASSFVSFVSFAQQNVDPYVRIFSLCLTIFLTLKAKKYHKYWAYVTIPFTWSAQMSNTKGYFLVLKVQTLTRHRWHNWRSTWGLFWFCTQYALVNFWSFTQKCICVNYLNISKLPLIMM